MILYWLALLLCVGCNVGLYALAYVFIVLWAEPMGYLLLGSAMLYSFMMKLGWQTLPTCSTEEWEKL